MSLFDTHCHIHEQDYPLPVDEVLLRAAEQDVRRMICVGTDLASSLQAINFVKNHENCWASIGIHPHEARDSVGRLNELAEILNRGKDFIDLSLPEDFKTLSSGAILAQTMIRDIVAIGECGLDYFYQHSDKSQQERALRFQIELALEHNLPLIFHVRDAFDDFWPIFDSYSGIRGVVHSFTDAQKNLAKLLERNLYVGINGIATFTKSIAQRDMFRMIPLEKMLLETDAPFLTPVPKRGTMNEPANVWLVAKFLSELRQEAEAKIAAQTTANAMELFAL